MTQGGIMERWLRAIGMTVPLVVLLGGCYEHTYSIGTGAPAGAIVYDEWKHHWLAGLISPSHEMDIQTMCPSGNVTIHNEQTFLNGLVSGLTGGIYSPTTVKVRCDLGGSADLDLGRGEIEGIVLNSRFLERVEELTPELLAEASEARAAALDR